MGVCEEEGGSLDIQTSEISGLTIGYIVLIHYVL